MCVKLGSVRVSVWCNGFCFVCVSCTCHLSHYFLIRHSWHELFNSSNQQYVALVTSAAIESKNFIDMTDIDTAAMFEKWCQSSESLRTQLFMQLNSQRSQWSQDICEISTVGEYHHWLIDWFYGPFIELWLINHWVSVVCFNDAQWLEVRFHLSVLTAGWGGKGFILEWISGCQESSEKCRMVRNQLQYKHCTMMFTYQSEGSPIISDCLRCICDH